MLIFDAHLDLAWNALEWNRDLLQPVSTIRDFEQQFPGCVPGDATTTLPALRKGNIVRYQASCPCIAAKAETRD